MAQPNRYQYQPLTGPIWRAPVAAALAWLPSGNVQPLRTLASALRIGCFALEPILAPTPSYNPNVLDWNVPPAVIQRRLPLGQRDQTVGVPFAALYRPDGLQWLPLVPPSWRQAVVGRLGCGVLDPIPPPNPAHLAWLPYHPPLWRRVLVGRLGDTVLDPIPPVNPAHLGWLSVAPFPSRLVPVRAGGTVLSPFPVAPAYDPAGLQWVYYAPPLWRVWTAGRLGSVVFHPVPIPAAPFDPAGLQWLLTGAPRPFIVRVSPAFTVTDPTPRLSAFLALQLLDQSRARYAVYDQSTARYFVFDQSHGKLVLDDAALVRYALSDQSRPLIVFKASPDDGSGTWSYTGELWSSIQWYWDGSWRP